MLSKRGEFKRNYLFCSKCIDWAKVEILKSRDQMPQKPHYSPISEASANRSTPDPFNEVMIGPVNDGMLDDVVGQRLANQSESPLHLGYREYTIYLCQNMTYLRI